MSDRFLFIRLSALGDVVNTLPALVALKKHRPDAEVDFVVEDRFADLVSQVEGVRHVFAFPRRGLRFPTPLAGWRLLRYLFDLRRETYATTIDFQANLKGALQLVASRAHRKLGASPAKEHAHRFYREAIPIAKDLHRTSRALALIEAAGVPVEHEFQTSRLDRSLLPTFAVDRDASRFVSGALGFREPTSAVDRREGRPLVLMHPGSSAFGALKRWPVGEFAAAAARLKESIGADVRVTCGPGEEALAKAVVTASNATVGFVPPVAGIPGLIALLRRAALVIASDSGPLHLAAALDVPCVAVFGPKDPAIYAPPWDHVRVVRRPPPCAPCTLRRCDDPICMTRIPADAVVEAALELLQSSVAPRERF